MTYNMQAGGPEVLEITYVKEQTTTTCFGIPHCMVNREERNFLTSLEADCKGIVGDQALVTSFGRAKVILYQ